MTQTEQALAKTEQRTTQLAQAGDEMSVEQLVERVRKVHHVQREVMKDGIHYGKVPGVDKPTLLKPGAEVLGMTFRLDPQFEITEQIREGNHLTLVVRCTLFHVPTGARLGSGMGSCSTKESRYAYRKGERACPKCGKETIIKGKTEFGGGWVCFTKKGGCNAKFGDNDPKITGQQVGRIENPDVYDQHNTVLKMAIKRAHVAAILFVTCASEIFTQDEEDLSTDDLPVETRAAREETQPTQRGNYKDRDADTEKRLETLLYDYTQAKTIADVDKLETERKKLWSKLDRNQKQVAKQASDLALERIQPAQDAEFEDEPMREPGDDGDELTGAA